MVNRLLSALACFVCLFFGVVYDVSADEGEQVTNISGSLGGEAWYAWWHSVGGLEKHGVNLDYKIKPSVIWGTHTSMNLTRDKTLLSGIVFDYFTSKMEKEVNQQAFQGNENSRDTYQEIKAMIDQRIGDGYFHLKMNYAHFEGELTLTQYGRTFNVPNGTKWNLDTEWFKADALYLFDLGVNSNMLPGVGLRYISYNKPEATSIFRDNGTVVDGMVQGDLISGQVMETKFKGYYLAFGILDKSTIGMPTESLFFYDALFYVGTAYAENAKIGKAGGNTGIGGGFEGDVGIKYSYPFTKSSGITGRLGYRVLYNKMSEYDEKGTDASGNDIWRETTTVDVWHGPFVGVILFF
jgi:hypothetical protein